MIEPDHVRLDEFLIGLQQRDAVRLDEIDVWQEIFLRKITQRFVHRQVELRIVHDLIKSFGTEWNPDATRQHDPVEQ